MTDRIMTPPATPAYREGWDRVFGRYGRLLFVNETSPDAADDPEHGLSPEKPFATTDYKTMMLLFTCPCPKGTGQF